MKKKLLSILFLIIPICLAGCNKKQPVQGNRNIKIYYVNDVHGAFQRQNTDVNYNEAGMAYISSYLKEKINEDPINSLLISGGDMFQGGFESNATQGDIMIDAMNEIGFDAMVLGNHEFDWGEDTLINIADKLECPIISCNTFYRESGDRPDYIEPYVIVERNDFKIGIIGAAQKDLNTTITGSISSHFSFPDPIPYIKDYAKKLRGELECDLVVTAIHDGGFDGNNYKFKPLCQLDVLSGRSVVDGVFLAHDHRYRSGYYLDVPYLESGCNGRYIGKMEFAFEYKDNKYILSGNWAENTQAFTTCKYEDKTITALLEKYKDQLIAGDEVLYTFKKSYSREEFVFVVCEAMMWYVNSRIDDFGGQQVYFANHNPGGIRVAVDAGPMTLSQITAVCPFDNNIYIIKSNTEQIRFMESDPDHYAVYKDENMQFEGDYTYGVAISYIIENETYGSRLYTEAVPYEITAKNILIEYLRNKINTNL